MTYDDLLRRIFIQIAGRMVEPMCSFVSSAWGLRNSARAMLLQAHQV